MSTINYGDNAHYMLCQCLFFLFTHTSIPAIYNFIDLLQRELKYLDAQAYFPRKLEHHHIVRLCDIIFRKGTKVKRGLRRGIWPHLVGVYHPQLKTHEEREMYIVKLRMVYDSLKGKWQGSRGEYNSQYQRLCDNIRRDAVRTDPTESFYASREDRGRTEDDNIQKLVNILVIYTLEHQGVSYTQGMTDLLSPILYVMQSEADAYLCFAAMLERIRQNFSTWCTGTLNKVERLRHLCEVLDPKLHGYLSNNIQEDAFALFFGMVLIECRREFSFQDSFHLLEVIWAAVISMQPPESETQPPSQPQTQSQWARYMTYESQDVVQQVFGETQSPYSAEPLGRTISVSQYSRNPSLDTQVSISSLLRHSAPLHIDTHTEEPVEPVTVYQHRNRSHSPPIVLEVEHSEPRKRSLTDPSSNQTTSPSVEEGPNLSAPAPKSSGKLNASFSHSESELYDSFSNTVPGGSKDRNRTELSEMSSISSGNGSSNFQASLRSSDGTRPGHRSNANSNDGSSSRSTGHTTSPKLELSTESTHRTAMIFTTPDNLQTSLEAQSSSEPNSHLSVNELVFDNSGSVEKDGPTPLQSHSQAPSRTTNDYLASGTGSLPLRYPADSDSYTQRVLSISEDEDDAAVLSVRGEDFSPVPSRVTPVAFFDTMEQLATTSTSPHHRSRANSDVSGIISQLISIDQSAPHVSRGGSLQVPFFDSFPLFICLAILVQNRVQIMQRRLDFVGLSVLLNTQAGMQNLPATLRVARHLYSIYRRYQAMCSCTGNGLNIWLDDTPVVTALQGTDSGSNRGARTGPNSEPASVNNSDGNTAPA